jgi:hypothetical protein
MSPPVACRLPRVSSPRRRRRKGGVSLLGAPPTLRNLRLPPLALGPRPVPAEVPVVCGHKALPSALGFRYNPHSL